MEEAQEIISITPTLEDQSEPVPVVTLNEEETLQLTGTLKHLDSLLQDMETEPEIGDSPGSMPFLSTLPPATSWWSEFVTKVLDSAVMSAATNLPGPSESNNSPPPVLSPDFVKQLETQTGAAEKKAIQAQAKLTAAEKDCCARAAQLQQSGLGSPHTVLQALLGMLKAEQSIHQADINIGSGAFKNKVRDDVGVLVAALSCLKFQMGEYQAIKKAILSELESELRKLEQDQVYSSAPMDLKQQFTSAHQNLLSLCKAGQRCVSCPKDLSEVESHIKLIAFDNDDFFADAIRQCIDSGECIIAKLGAEVGPNTLTQKTIPKTLITQAKALLKSFADQDAKKKELTQKVQALDDQLVSIWATGKPDDDAVHNLQSEQSRLSEALTECESEHCKLKQQTSEVIATLNNSVGQIRQERGRKAMSKVSDTLAGLRSLQARSRSLNEEKAVRDLAMHKKRVAIKDEADELLSEEGQRRSNALFRVGLMALEEMARHGQEHTSRLGQEQASIQRRMKATDVGRDDFLSRLAAQDPAGYHCVQNLSQNLADYVQSLREHVRLLDLGFAVEQARDVLARMNSP